MDVVIGIVSSITGDVSATSVNGFKRELQSGDPIYADELISTLALSSISIIFSDNSTLDLGRNSEVSLDETYNRYPTEFPINELADLLAPAAGDNGHTHYDSSDRYNKPISLLRIDKKLTAENSAEILIESSFNINNDLVENHYFIQTGDNLYARFNPFESRDTAAAIVNFSSINHAPILSHAGDTLLYNKGESAQFIDTDLSISDIDNSNIKSASVNISGGFIGTEDRLTYVDANGITGSFNAATGVLNLVGEATKSIYEMALESVSYINSNSTNANSANRTINWTINDGQLDSNSATSTITIANEAPKVNVNQDRLQLDGSSDYLNLPTIAANQGLYAGGSYNGLSIVATVTMDTIKPWSKILSLSEGGPSNDNIIIGNLSNTDSFIFEIFVGNVFQRVEVVNFFTIGVEVHVAVTQAMDGTVTIYKDGNAIDLSQEVVFLKGVRTTSGSLTLHIPDNVVLADNLIGKSHWNDGLFDGSIDDLALFAKALSASEVSASIQGDFSGLNSDPKLIFHYGFDGDMPLLDESNHAFNATVSGSPQFLPATITYMKQSAGTLLDDKLQITDSDNTQLSGATIKISSGFVNGEDLLQFSNTAEIVGLYNAGSGVLTLSGTATIAQYQTALRSVSYRNSNDTDPITTVRTISWQINDDSKSSAIVTSTVKVSTVTNSSTPLILDLDGDGVETLSFTHSINFDINADGINDKTGWVAPDDGLLVRDINGDGFINDGSELFGQETIKADGTKAQDGFLALAELDSNKDGLIDQNDALFNELKIWQDLNSDGISQSNELLSLQQWGISQISLSTQAVSYENNGNIIGLTATYTDVNGAEHDIADVWFAYQSGLDDEQSSGSSVSEIIDGDAADNINDYLNDNFIYGLASEEQLFGNTADDQLSGSLAGDVLTGDVSWHKANLSGNDHISDFDHSQGDVINLTDLLADGSHTIEALAVNNAEGTGQHLQLSIKTAGVEVHTIDLDNIVVDISSAPAMLTTLLSDGSINDGID